MLRDDEGFDIIKAYSLTFACSTAESQGEEEGSWSLRSPSTSKLEAGMFCRANSYHLTLALLPVVYVSLFTEWQKEIHCTWANIFSKPVMLLLTCLAHWALKQPFLTHSLFCSLFWHVPELSRSRANTNHGCWCSIYHPITVTPPPPLLLRKPFKVFQAGCMKWLQSIGCLLHQLCWFDFLGGG